MKSVNGKLVPQSEISKPSYKNHLLIVRFFEKNEQEGNNDGLVQRILKVSVKINGAFVFELPEKDALEGEISLTIKGPDNRIISVSNYSYSSLYPSSDPLDDNDSAEFKMEVDPYIPMDLVSDGKTPPYTVRGRILSGVSGMGIANQNAFVKVLPKDSGANSNKWNTILGFKTDSFGYFSFLSMGEPYNSAKVSLTGNSQIQLELVLDKKGFLNGRQLLVIDRELDSDKDKDCHCRDETPSQPDAEDLAISPAFSTEKIGACVDFTVPNRSLEEYHFYLAVKTTEPEIKRIPWQKPFPIEPQINEDSILIDTNSEAEDQPPPQLEEKVNPISELIEAKYRSGNLIFREISYPGKRVKLDYSTSYNGDEFFIPESYIQSKGGGNPDLGKVQRILESKLNGMSQRSIKSASGMSLKMVGQYEDLWWPYKSTPTQWLTSFFQKNADQINATRSSEYQYNYAFEYFLQSTYPDLSGVGLNPYDIWCKQIAERFYLQIVNNSDLEFSDSSPFEFWVYCIHYYYDIYNDYPVNPIAFEDFIQDVVANLEFNVKLVEEDKTDSNEPSLPPVKVSSEEKAIKLRKWWLFLRNPPNPGKVAAIILA